MHHIVTDGWSLDIILRELAALYNAGLRGSQPQLPHLPVRYVDYVSWEIERTEHPEVATQIRQWADDLSDAPTVLPLPTDRARSASPSSAGHNVRFTISRSKREAIDALCRKLDVTPFAIYMATWAATLHLNGAGEDIVIGVPFAGRNREEASNLVGFFVNTLGMRVRLSADEPFADLAESVKSITLEAMRRQEAPFEKIVELLNPARLLGSTPVFQTALAYLSTPLEILDFDSLRCQHLTAYPDETHFDSILSIDEGVEAIEGRLLARSDLFELSTCERLVECSQRIIDDVCSSPSTAVEGLWISAADERRSLIENSKGAEPAIPAEPVHRLFERRGQEAPERTAVFEGAITVSFRQLNERADRVATALRLKGIQPGSIVAVMLDRSADFISVSLGVLKVGCAYLPIERTEPPERLAEILEAAEPSTIVARASTLSETEWGDLPLLSLEEAVAHSATGETSYPSLPDAPAYVMFTSGSTGRPKGVVIPHRAVVGLVFGTDFARFSSDEVFLHMASPAFDASTFEIWGALLHGGACAVVPSRRPSTSEIRATIAAHRVTTAWLTSSLFNFVVDEDPAALGGLRRLLIGGEALSVTHVRRALEALPGTCIINGYGPTECTTFALCHTIPRDLPADVPSVPIGRPIANTEAYILNRLLEPVRDGIPGELYLGGLGLASGYFNDPELTRQRFIPHLFQDDSHARLYRTGDFVRRVPDGTIEFLGRRDGQVKVRGFRIELGEIEHHLLENDRIAQAVAVVHESTPTGKQILAYVVQVVDASLTESALRASLESKLPPFMMPSRFVILETLPLTASGKVDRGALPAPPARTEDSPQEPAEDLEAKIASIWRQVLGGVQVRRDDNFFDLGGHSLLAARVIGRIGKEIGREIPISALFEAPTPQSMATLIRQGRVLDPFVAPVQAKGSLPAFLCLGMGPMYRPLAARLGDDRPFLGIGLRAADLMQLDPPYTLEQLAGLLADKIIERFPTGPYILGGWCLEAILAYETSRQLALRGKLVDLVVLFDPSDPERLAELAEPLHPGRMAERLWFHAKKLRQVSVRDTPHYIARRARELGARGHRATWVAAQRQRNNQREQEPHAGHAIYLAACEYQPKPVECPVAVIVPADAGRERMSAVNASWSRVVGSNAKVYETTGDHAGMFQEPYVQKLAALMRDIFRLQVASGISG